MFYQSLIRPVLFLFNPETAHRLVTRALSFIWAFALGRWLTRIFCGISPTPRQSVLLGSLPLQNAVGLAAGFDKNGELLKGIETLGFGFVEIGTVTPQPQPGNPKPRIFRDAKSRALINRLGFNNDGAVIVAERLRAAKKKIRIPVGVNVGKNKDTPLERAKDDYIQAIQAFHDVADYFTVNVSSPNTPGLRDLQNVAFLKALGVEIKSLNLTQAVFLKLAPEVGDEDLRAICGLILPGKLYSGLVLTNTLASDAGGISGEPLRHVSGQRLQAARAALPQPVPIISVGGISTAEDARRRQELGATAVQIYTGLIYEGPSLIPKILAALS